MTDLPNRINQINAVMNPVVGLKLIGYSCYETNFANEPEQSRWDDLPVILKFDEKKHLFPESTAWVPVRGGDHGQFGDNVGGMFKEFGMFIRGMDEEEWEATQWKASISRSEQQAIIADAMLDWFSRVLAE